MRIIEKINALNPKIIFTEEEFEQFLRRVKISEGDMFLKAKLTALKISYEDSCEWLKKSQNIINETDDEEDPNDKISILRISDSFTIALNSISSVFNAIKKDNNFLEMSILLEKFR
jgi:hypothetical protein